MFQEKHTFILFPESDNIHNYVSFNCTQDEFNKILVDEEFLGPSEHYSEFDWVIFKDGKMIQG